MNASPNDVSLTFATVRLLSRLRSPSAMELIPLIWISPWLGSRWASGCCEIPWIRLGWCKRRLTSEPGKARR